MKTTTAAKETPILFNSEMIRAVLEDRKTQTRRVVKPQPVHHPIFPNRTDFWGWKEQDDILTPGHFGYNGETDWMKEAIKLDCPYGQKGDHLWARERFSISAEGHEPDGHYWLTYGADGAQLEIDYSEITMGRLKPGKSYPSIFMPRWASRITLEITDVRAEQLQEISLGDAQAEAPPACDTERSFGDYRDCFRVLWDSINAKHGFAWETNCWVYVVAFKRIETR